MAELKTYLEHGDHLLLPMAAVVETGNHIAHCQNRAHARDAAARFVDQVGKALRGKAPWRMTRFPINEQVLEWLADFPDSVSRGIGFGDLSIIKEWEGACAKYPLSRVLIWSRDRQDLGAYDRTV
ncbi:hypothetical protein OPU71_14200 [Niveibacterium sp. 24ML]|uniref:hypothetical protein n=1 Tax=Niveibacterium sp. 24ML TaxID=2985512 RepID=UPI00226E28F0|nr:hypothetical protein [Niveibacterium sp. 24ML]MCX9157278.1 hypothetical protein [Niveibacterium sp. 24ML]